MIRAATLLAIIFAPILEGGILEPPKKGPDWPAINEKVWELTPKDFPTKPEAVVLESSIYFTGWMASHFRRVLVLSDAGRALAELTDLHPNTRNFQGRIVQRNGSLTELRPERDLVIIPVLSGKGWDIQRLKVLTPGLSNHCIVDYRWEGPALVNANGELGTTGLMWKLSSAMPIVRLTLVIDRDASIANWHPAFEVDPACRPKLDTLARGAERYTFWNIPPFSAEPFTSTADLGRPTFFFFSVPDNKTALTELYGQAAVRDLKLDFWNEVSKIQYWNWYEKGTELTDKFRTWADLVYKDLPPEPGERAQALVRRLQQKIKPFSQLTRAEAALLPKETMAPAKKSKCIEEAIDSGYTSDYGMRLLFLQSLRHVGLRPIILETVDRFSNRLRLKQKNIAQFDCTLVGVRNSTGDLIAFDPVSRWSSGMVSPQFQGSEALLFVTDRDQKNWHALEGRVPSYGSDLNQEDWRFRINAEEEGDSIEIHGKCSGARAWEIRSKLGPSDFQEQIESFKNLLSEGSIDWQWETLFLENASSPEKELGWRGSFSRERTPSRNLEVSPFPGLLLPFSFPDQWPESRLHPIQMPYVGKISAESRILLPQTYEFPPPVQIQHTNSLGTVTWSLQPVSRPDSRLEGVIQLTIEIKQIKAPANDYQSLKELVGWVQESVNRKLRAKKVERTP